ncbi:hypothetical protein R6Q59_036259 [Mikania micrantha]|uniref:RBR-type E3 ubiquitin transferase n=1 Tax=Mikania micrantha TaxID=192012 RepID=A0A5N6NBQ4_9ASTR|nr:hypothetical protein E3N88_22500 [Mikania micrantha]KAD4584913.1 hypothetical protein E3N88_22514 [Mikania micrantha]
MNMAGSSSSDLYHIVDDFYFSALHDDDEIFPISDEKYAQELQLQEALISSSSSLIPSSSSSSSSSKKPLFITSSSLSSSSSISTYIFCNICMDTKTESEMFHNTNVCAHLFCSDCIREHVAAKIKANLTTITCPDPNCETLIGPESCRPIVPKPVLERWESILCESLILESDKFYCPFKDCSAMLVDDGGVAVTSSECPNCNRLFCAQCKVAWHCGLNCADFQCLKNGKRTPDDKLFMDLANNKRWKKCSKCCFFVEKTDGCQHITCRCGHQFCYGCGQPWSQSHVCATVMDES